MILVILNHAASTSRWLVNNEFTMMKKKEATGSNSRYYRGNRLVELGKTTKPLSQDSRWPWWDSNLAYRIRVRKHCRLRQSVWCLSFLRYYFVEIESMLEITRVGTLIVATIYLQLIQNRYMFRSFTILQCSHQHCVQPVASDVEVVGYL